MIACYENVELRCGNCLALRHLISVLCNFTMQKNSHGAPHKDVGHENLEGHSGVLPLIVNRASHGLLLMCDEIADTIEF